jgi:hypothetical protein
MQHLIDEIGAEEPLTCVICGRPLGYSSDDQPEWPTGPMCGDCYQSREMDNEIWAAELGMGATDDAELAEDSEL